MQAIAKKHTVPLVLLVVADVDGQVVMVTEVMAVAVVREGMIVGSKVLGASGEWKKTKYKTKSYHANKTET